MMVQQVTPNQLQQTQDQLLLAGSKLSFRDIYDLEMDIPIVKKQYYHADKVDNVFVLLNGVLTDVSQEAYRNQLLLVEARDKIATLEKELVSINERLAQYDVISLQNEIDQMDNEMDLLENALNQMENRYYASREQVQSLQKELLQTQETNLKLVNYIKDKVR